MAEWEDALRALIKERYGSLRAFTEQAGLPYMTVYNMLKRGIANSKAENITAFYNALNIDWKSMTDFTTPDYSVLKLKSDHIEDVEIIAVEEFASDERELIDSYRRLSESDKLIVHRIILALETIS